MVTKKLMVQMTSRFCSDFDFGTLIRTLFPDTYYLSDHYLNLIISINSLFKILEKKIIYKKTNEFQGIRYFKTRCVLIIKYISTSKEIFELQLKFHIILSFNKVQHLQKQQFLNGFIHVLNMIFQTVSQFHYYDACAYLKDDM